MALLADVEIRGLDTPASEVVAYHGADVREVNGGKSFLHRDHLASIRALTAASGVLGRITSYKPYGPAIDTNSGPTVPLESKGFTGERFGAASGLLYLNARFYDPSLGRFVRPESRA